MFILPKEAGRIEEMMKTLPDIQQATLRMKHIDGLEVAEIARIIGSSEERYVRICRGHGKK